MTPRPRPARRAYAGRGSALAAAIDRADWERVALCLLAGAMRSAAEASPGTLEDLLAVLAKEERDGPQAAR